MIENPPNFDLILRADLQNDDRLAELLVQAVRRKLWPNNSPKDVLDFWSLAEKALHDDSFGTPGGLFRSLVQKRQTDRITNACEQRALNRLNSKSRHELYIRAGVKPNPLMPDGDPSPGLSLAPSHIGFQHGVFMACPFPQKRLPETRRDWFVKHQNKTIAVTAGYARNPDGTVGLQEVPYGATPRLILPYIIGKAIRSGPRVDMGKNLLRFFELIGMTPTGRNYRTVTDQVRNIAASQISVHITRHNIETDECEFLDGYYRVTKIHGRGKLVMFDRDEVPPEIMFADGNRQPPPPSAWNSRFCLTHDFYEFVRENAVPVNMQHLACFTKSPRRMDMYMWLSYRTPWIPPKRKEVIPLCSLQRLFAPDMDAKFYRTFKKRLCEDIFVIRSVHKGFNVEVSGDVLILRHSDPAVPFRPTRDKYTR